VEYPGYSVYNDSKSAEKILEDSKYIMDFLQYNLKISSKLIFLFGRSIGSGPATYLSSIRDIGGLILMSAYTSIKGVARNLVGSFLAVFVSER